MKPPGGRATASAAPALEAVAVAAAGSGDTFRERVEAALRRCVPWAEGLAPGREALLQMSGSASNFLYRVDVRAAGSGSTRRLCLRRAQHAQVAIPHAVEAEVMQAARERGAVVPEVCGVLPAGDPVGSGFFMAWVEGEGRGEKIAAAFAENGRGGQLGRQCGDSLARIQSLRVESLPPLPKGPATPLKYLASLRRQYALYGVCRPALEYTFVWLEAHAPPDSPEEQPVLVHGDFRSANIMAHPERGLAGVIDWEMAHTGNRYEDIGWICVRTWRYGMLHKPVGGFADLSDFCEGYEAAGGAPIDRDAVWWWALAGSARWAILCLQQGAAFRDDASRFENGVVGRRTCEGELDCLITIAEAAGGVEAVLAGAEGGLGELRSDGVEADAGFPACAELVSGAQRLLSGQVLKSLTSSGDVRSAFLVRVVNNALGMVIRSLQMGPSADEAEAASLIRLLGPDVVARAAGGAPNLWALRRALVAELQSGSLPPERPGLLEHLLLCTGRQTLMDQPKYASLATVRSKL